MRLGATDKLRAAAGGEEEGDDAWGVEGDKCDEGEVAVLSWSGLLHPKALSRALQSVLSNLRCAAACLYSNSADPLTSPVSPLRTRSLSPPLPFLDLSLTPFAHAPLSHLSAASPPVVGTSKRPNGKKRKRGRGRGEEEEADRARVEDEGGWACVLRPREEGQGAIEWHLWEGQ